MRQQVSNPDVLLPVGRELRPVRRDSRVEVEQAAIGHHQRGQARHGLGARPDVDDGVSPPLTAIAAPTSAPLLSSSASASATLSNRASTWPCTAFLIGPSCRGGHSLGEKLGGPHALDVRSRGSRVGRGGLGDCGTIQNADEQEFTFFGAQTSSCMSIDDALRARLFIASLTIVWRLLALAPSGK